jgi:tellurite resistance protein TehA-like permease
MGRHLVPTGARAQLHGVMKTAQLIPAWMLYLLAPMVALAQSGPDRENQIVLHSSSFWYWVTVTVVAAVAFAIYTVYLSRRREPPHRPSTP